MEVLLLISELLISPISTHMFIIKAIQKLFLAKTRHKHLFEKPKNVKKLKKKDKQQKITQELTLNEQKIQDNSQARGFGMNKT